MRYFLRRLVQTIFTLFLLSFLIFAVLHLIPGDPAIMMAGPQAGQEEIERIRDFYGLNEPIYIQYGGWLRRIMIGDFGISHQAYRSVGKDIFFAFPISIKISFWGIIVAAIFGIPLGILSALRQNSIIDFLIISFSVLGMSIPVFWLGLMSLLLFSVKLGWLPSSGWGTLSHYILPVISVSVVSIALISRLTRSGLIEALEEDYIRTARAKGLKEKVVIYKHALKNISLPIVTAMALRFGILLGGAAVTETIFSIPGLGRMIVEAVQMRDFPVIQGGVLVIAFSISLINLSTDLLYTLIDPRIEYN